jgi:hypothetical protein
MKAAKIPLFVVSAQKWRGDRGNGLAARFAPQQGIDPKGVWPL